MNRRKNNNFLAVASANKTKFGMKTKFNNHNLNGGQKHSFKPVQDFAAQKFLKNNAPTLNNAENGRSSRKGGRKNKPPILNSKSSLLTNDTIDNNKDISSIEEVNFFLIFILKINIFFF